MAKGKKAASRKTAKHQADRSAATASRPSATFSSLPPELLRKILSLTGRPAAFATVCRSWENTLRDSSGSSGSSSLWSHVDLYGSKHGAPYLPLPEDGGHLCSWLQQRAKGVHSITFHRFTKHPVLLSMALGLLGYAPLRRLDFDQCVVDTELLLALRMTSGITHLRLQRLSGSAEDPFKAQKLGRAVARLPLLEDLEVHFEAGGNSAYPNGYTHGFKWPGAICTRTKLTRLTIADVKVLPANISTLVNLRTLTLYGTGLNSLPSSVGRLTNLTSLASSFVGRRSDGYMQYIARTVISPEAAGMTALQRLSLTTRECPAGLSVLTRLSSLTIGELYPWDSTIAEKLQAAVARMPGLHHLQLHHSRSLSCPTYMAGLRDILASVPKLRDLCLDHNAMQMFEAGALGPYVTNFRELDLGGNRFDSVPKELERAMGCRSLTLSLSPGTLHKELGSLAAAQSSPLLAMPQLRTLRLSQADWKGEDVEAVLHLRQAFDAQRLPGGQPIAITCPQDALPAPEPGQRPPLVSDSEEDDESDEEEDEDGW